MHLDTYSQSPWFGSWDSADPLNEIFPTDKSITEVMSLEETPWKDTHNRSLFLSSLGEISSCLDTFVSRTLTHPLQTPILVHKVLSEGNMGKITATMPIDISVKPRIVENIHVRVSCSHDKIKIYTALFKEFCDAFAWSYEEIPDIDSSIVVHEMLTYLDANPVRQQLHLIHPREAATIKGEVEKLLKVGFINPIPLTDWVSNIVPVTKRQGTIRVCVDYHDIN